MCVLHTTQPVSYTHLDVYKRQPLYIILHNKQNFQQNSSSLDFFKKLQFSAKESKNSPLIILLRQCNYVSSVSYHLLFIHNYIKKQIVFWNNFSRRFLARAVFTGVHLTVLLFMGTNHNVQ